MVEYFGKHGCKQAIRSKPVRFGYKVWCQNLPLGYLAAFDLYQGKTYHGNEEVEFSFGKSASSVLHLVSQYSISKSSLPYHFYFDNLFTTFPLLKELKEKGYNGTGTIRANRIGKSCPLASNKSVEKKDRGYMDVATAEVDNHCNIIVTKWRDNAVVTVASTLHEKEPEGSARRWSKAEKQHVIIPVPTAIQHYNSCMSGTDRMDQNINA